jgi:putative inorganic carbon (HCO3(-)) transporter
LKALLFTYVLTAGGALGSFVNPFAGFLVYVAFGIIKPDSLWWWSVPPWNYSRAVAIGFLLGWMLHGCGSWRFGRGTLILVCLVGFWVIMVLSAINAPYPDLAWEPVEPMAKVILPIIAGATLIDSIQKLKQLIWVIVLCQGYLAYEFNLIYFYSHSFVPWEWTHGGLDNNGIAITMVTSVGMAFFLGMHAPKTWQRLLALTCAAMMAHVVLFSNSRGGMLSLIITGFFAFLLLPKRLSHLFIFGLAIVGVLATTGEGARERFMSSFISKEEGGDEGGRRLEHWAGCVDTMIKKPLGVGPNHWPVTGPLYGLPEGQAAHSTWLQTGAELGLPGLTCLLGFYVLTIRRLYTYLKDRTPVLDPWFHYTARMTISSLVGFLVAAQFVTIHGVELPYYITLVGIGTIKLQHIHQH